MAFAQVEAVLTLVIGCSLAFIGWVKFSPKVIPSLRWVKIIQLLLFGIAFGATITLQTRELVKNSDGEGWIWAMIFVPLVCAFLFAIFQSLGIASIGIYTFVVIGQGLYEAVEDHISRDLFLEGMAFVGAIFAVLVYKNQLMIIIMLMASFAGGAFMLNGLNCFINQVPAIRPLDDYVAEELNPGEKLTCGTYSRDLQDIIIFYSVCTAISLIGGLLQILFGAKALSYTRKKEAAFSFANSIKAENMKELAEKILELTPEEEQITASVKNEGDYMPFKAHDRILKIRLQKLGLRERPPKGCYNDSQLASVSDQLSLFNIQQTPEDIRKKVVKWLRKKTNWTLLTSLPNDPLGISRKNHREYVNSIQHGSWADFITLQAIVQVYRIPIIVFTSLSGSQCVKKFSLLADYESTKYNKVTFITFDNQKITTTKDLAKKSPVLAKLLLKNEVSYEIKMTNPTHTAENLNATLRALEATEGTKGEKAKKALEAFGVEQVATKPKVELEDVNKDELLRLSYYWGYHYGSLETIPRDLGSTELDDDAPFMRSWKRPHMRIILIRFTQVGIILTGTWWLLWMIIFGHQFGNFFEGMGYLLFFIAEFVNFILNIIYNFNFWNPIYREWKSLDRLTNPKFAKKHIVNTMIFHYSEPPEDTARTLKGALFMNKMKETTLRVYVCDDGFWMKRKNPNAPPPKPKLSTWGKIKKALFTVPTKNDDINLVKPPTSPENENLVVMSEEPPADVGKKKGGIERTVRIAELRASIQLQDLEKHSPDKEESSSDSDEVEIEPRLESSRRLSTKLRATSALTVWDDSHWEDEEFNAFRHPLLEYVELKYGVVPKTATRWQQGTKEMIDSVRQEVYRYYSEKCHRKVYVKFWIDLKTPNEDVVEYDDGESYQTKKLYRTDCSKASLSYHFYATFYPSDGIDKRIPGPEVILVARVKSEPHHYKAGNINNVIYNEGMEGSFAVFLDNDMKPKNDFLLRTLPWFYYYSESEQNYVENESISFVQTPQFFKDSTVHYEDFLGGRNSVFFQGIQNGRDGFDLCAFAGTNAIFRLKSLYAVGGMPYGSVTEDASLAIEQHKFGYRSIYIPDKLAVGLAPVTPANSMQQRSRWVKGSVQMFINEINPWRKYERYDLHWRNNPIFVGDSYDRVAYMGVPASYVPTRNFFRKMYKIDTLMYPFSAITAINYMIVAILFIISGIPPVNFGGANAFLYTFIPYFFLKNLSQFLSYNRVRANDIWVAQQIWFTYAFASLFGVLDAFKEALTGSSLAGWGVTGEGKRTSNLEWFNLIMVVIMILSIIIRGAIILVEPITTETALGIAAIFFVSTIVIMMWPMTSATIYEWIYNSQVKNQVDLGRIRVPNYIIYAATLILVIAFVEFKNLDQRFS